uniref:Uncharacterized protein n=1 Tax=Plectus sambesii TaxID=2011161 RepID=A0A914V0D5_9BILA
MPNAVWRCGLLLLLLFAAASARGGSEVRVVAGKDATLACEPAITARKRMGPDYDGPDLVRRVEWRQNGAIVASYQQGFAVDAPRQWWVSSARMQWVRGLYSLVISTTEVTDTASYECRIEIDSAFDAPYAEKPGVVRLIVVGKPDPPGRAIVSSFTARSVTLSWPHSATPPHIPIQRYMVMVSYGNRPDLNSHKLVYANGNETTLVVSSLRPYTEYTFQAIAENEAGRSSPGQSVTARTKGEAPVAAPVIKQIRNGTDGTLIVEWEPPPPMTLHGPLVGHRLMAHQLRTGAMKEWYVQGSTTRVHILRGLNVYTKYMISVEADNNFGYSPMASMIVTTDEGVPSNGPDVTSLQVKSSESIYLSWVPPKEPNGVIVSYFVYYLTPGREAQPVISEVNANTSSG